MTIDEAVSIVDKRFWEQTEALLGPLPEGGQADAWFAQRDKFWKEIQQELKSQGPVCKHRVFYTRFLELIWNL